MEMYPPNIQEMEETADSSKTYKEIIARMQLDYKIRSDEMQDNFRKLVREERRNWESEALNQGKICTCNCKYSIYNDQMKHTTSFRQETPTGHEGPIESAILKERKPTIHNELAIREEIFRSKEKEINCQISFEMAETTAMLFKENIENIKHEVLEEINEAKSKFRVNKEAISIQDQDELKLMKDKMLMEKEQEIKNEIEKEMVEKKKQLFRNKEEEILLQVEKETSELRARLLQDREKEIKVQVETICSEMVQRMETEYIAAATDRISNEIKEREYFLRSEMKRAMIAKLENESDDMALRILQEKSQEIERSLEQNILEIEFNIRSKKEKEVQEKVEIYAREYEQQKLKQICENIDREIEELGRSVKGQKEIQVREEIGSETKEIKREDEHTVENTKMEYPMSNSSPPGRKSREQGFSPVVPKQKQIIDFYSKQVGPELKNNSEGYLRKFARDVVRNEVEKRSKEQDRKLSFRSKSKISEISSLVGREKDLKIKEMKVNVSNDLNVLEKKLRLQIEEKIKREIDLVERCMQLEGGKAIKENIEEKVKEYAEMFKTMEKTKGNRIHEEFKPTISRKLQKQKISEQRNEKKQNQRRHDKDEKKKQEKEHKAMTGGSYTGGNFKHPLQMSLDWI